MKLNKGMIMDLKRFKWNRDEPFYVQAKSFDFQKNKLNTSIGLTYIPYTNICKIVFDKNAKNGHLIIYFYQISTRDPVIFKYQFVYYDTNQEDFLIEVAKLYYYFYSKSILNEK